MTHKLTTLTYAAAALCAVALFVPLFSHADITTGLVGHWTLDEGTGAVAADQTASNADADLDGQTWVAGHIGSGALAFTSDIVTVDTAVQTPFLFERTDPFTLAGWAYIATDACANQCIIISKYIYIGYQLAHYDWNGMLVFLMINSNNSAGIQTQADSVPLDEWFHWVAVNDGTGNASGMKIYINGAHNNGGTHSDNLGSNTIIQDTPVRFGGDEWTTPSFVGSLDEIRIYNRALTSGDVAELYAYTGASGRTTLVKPPNNLGLVGYWSFNEGTGTKATDFSGNGNTGTLTGSPTWVSGKRGKALTFSNANDSYVSAGSGINLVNSSFTVSAWAKRSSSGTYDVIVGQGAQSQYQGLSVGFRDTNTFICSFWNNDLDTSSTYVDTDWHHWVCTYDVATNARIIYRDGVNVANDTAGGDYQGSGTFLIGDSIFANANFDGAIDEVRIYNRVLGAAEVAALAKAGAVKIGASSVDLQKGSTLTSGLVGHWTFDGADTPWTSPTAGTTLDRSGNGNTGTLTNMSRDTTPAIGKLGQGLVFDGVLDYVSIPRITAIEPPNSVSYCAWTNLRSAEAYETFMRHGSAVANESYNLQINDTGTKYAFAVWSGSYSAEGGTVALNVWTHLCGTFDGSTMRIYVNGSDVGSDGTGTATTPSGSVPGMIGSANEFAFIDGRIDDARTYNRALTAAEVKELYKLGRVLIRP